MKLKKSGMSRKLFIDKIINQSALFGIPLGAVYVHYTFKDTMHLKPEAYLLGSFLGFCFTPIIILTTPITVPIFIYSTIASKY